MKRLFIFILLLSLSRQTIGQKKNKFRLGPIPCIDYKYQNLNTFGFYLGVAKLFKRHTYFAIVPGLDLVRFNKISYATPSIFFDYYYQPKKLKGYIGPVCRLGFTPIKITGQKVNYCLERQDIKEITKFRIGYRFL